MEADTLTFSRGLLLIGRSAHSPARRTKHRSRLDKETAAHVGALHTSGLTEIKGAEGGYIEDLFFDQFSPLNCALRWPQFLGTLGLHKRATAMQLRTSCQVAWTWNPFSS